ncbi:MAG: protein kinase [marine benthic group bacterium]|jgi:serine/threonine protein kinase|nr:protein kinase [Gemmatimonadota bacterium]MCL7967154.1 protein kinase [Gemmatimonadota bacterium]MCL7969239.1 protein kinase [Gemmatimonadota bacterium]MCL7973052.1 protein kinase [Gemmatimonadota bacterium]MCL7978077.1 protein kinase [Gemmatimonadota bacterium]
MTELLDRLHAALTGVYSLDRELGRGGMSTVFLARDLKHDRDVALKVLRPDLASAVGSDRFLREIKVTAALNHPHILPLLDSGSIDELVYYVMPFVTGGSLRDRLNADGPLQIAEVLRILGQVAAALDYAHRMGIVHRDIKPENILFSEGLAVVADFGIAQAVAQADRVTLTRTGYPVGTLGYMSPEQAAGRTDLDHHTDVFSLGAVAYEMLIGQTPDGWPAPEDSRLGRLTDAPADHRARLDAMPGRVEQALARALALRPSDRFDSTGALHAALAKAAGERIVVPEDEMREIFERAAELEAKGPDPAPAQGPAPTGTEALTMGAVEQVAAEIGIPPERVREAALGVRREASGSAVTGSGSGSVAADRTSVAYPSSPDVTYQKNLLRAERVIPVEMDETQLPLLVPEIEEELKLVGHASLIGRTLTWSPAAQGVEGRQVVVTVRPRGEGTEVQIAERIELSGWKMFAPGWGTGLGALFGLFLAASLGLQEAGLLVGAVPGAFLGAFMMVKGIENTITDTRRPELQHLLERLSTAVRDCGRPNELPGAGRTE